MDRVSKAPGTSWRDRFEGSRPINSSEHSGSGLSVPYEIRQFYVMVSLDEEQGTALIEEKITYRHYEGFRKHTRAIPLDGHSISKPSILCKEYTTGISLQLLLEDKLATLSWGFPETLQDLTFVLRYTIHGCMRYRPSQTLDEFSLNLLTPFIKAPIKHFQVQISIPPYRDSCLYDNYWTLNGQPKSKMLLQYDKIPKLVFRKDGIKECGFLGIYMSWMNRKKFSEKDRATQNAIVQSLYHKQQLDSLNPYQNGPVSICSSKANDFMSSLSNVSSLDSEAIFLRNSIADEHISVLEDGGDI